MTGREAPTEVLLAAIGNALRNGSYMTGANLAFVMLCERLGVDDDALVFDPLWARAAPPPEGGEALWAQGNSGPGGQLRA